MIKITCFGEVLWDMFPTHEKIGGAPLNVATRLKSFGNDVSMISRIGKDEKGDKIIDFFKANNVNVEGIQTDSSYETGHVTVMLNDKGSASYDIKYPSAWDKIELSETAKSLVKSSDAFIFGSLVTRDDESRSTLYELLPLAKSRIFDVNLREPYYTKDILVYLMNQADFIKFNDEEIFEIAKYLDSDSQSLEQNIRFISEVTNTKTICVTKGRHGAILYYNDTFYYNSGYQIVVKDTVGAGDSFLASLINKLLKEDSPQEAIDFACAVGALVASKEGANPEITEETIASMMGEN
ncbi:carbohydrate kinase family protein [Mariniflexile sp. AS56]|uniref:carbohydrate kinase family protein n=1 Tax=Mariniflexile sp. AS56 TaxID=3063957 RepID=UPI0026F059C8|nr:carbohydrate kinase [Mariniflexile sp. AS56]MDO7171697.1 carbohydrate kinase [Mariniflexile sp. AS56]